MQYIVWKKIYILYLKQQTQSDHWTVKSMHFNDPMHGVAGAVIATFEGTGQISA